MKFSPRISLYFIESILPSKCCRLPVPEAAKQLQRITKPPPCFTVGRLPFILPPPDRPLIHWPKKFQFNLITVSVHLTVETETSVPAAIKSCCRSFAVTRGILATSLLRNLVGSVASFLFLPCPSKVASVPFNFAISRNIQYL